MDPSITGPHTPAVRGPLCVRAFRDMSVQGVLRFVTCHPLKSAPPLSLARPGGSLGRGCWLRSQQGCRWDGREAQAAPRRCSSAAFGQKIALHSCFAVSTHPQSSLPRQLPSNQPHTDASERPSWRVVVRKGRQVGWDRHCGWLGVELRGFRLGRKLEVI